MRKQTITKFYIICASALMMSALSGCGSDKEDALVAPVEPVYESAERETVEVKRGNIIPFFESKLDLLDYNKVSYRFTQAQYDELMNNYKLEVDKVNVKLGDYVNAGDVLVSFHSKVLDEKIKANEEKIASCNLQIEHLQKLHYIDPEQDYSEEIAKLNRDINAANLYISDIKTAYGKMNLVATEGGIVSYVNTIVINGYVVPDKDIVSVVSDSGYYIMDQNDICSFTPGQKYTAKSGTSTCEVEVVETPEGGDSNKVYFKPNRAPGQLLEKVMLLSFELPELKDVVYVNKYAIAEKDDKKYVYVKGEDGFYNVQEVKTGDKVDTDIIIKEGLNGGEIVQVQ